MKNIALALFLVATLALGALAWHQRNQLAQTRMQLAEVQNQLKDKSGADEQIARAERKSKVLQETLVETSKYATEQSQQAEQLQQSLAAAKTNGANPFAAMFKDPKMKEMIKSSQKAVLGPMLDKQYAALFQQLKLTPDQAAGLKDLLQKKMSAATDAGMSLLDGSLDAAQRADLAKQVKGQTDEYEAQIKQFLGDDNYQAFQAYEKTTPDRMTVSQFSDQLSGGATPLSPDQQQQLVQMVSDERNNFKWTTDYSNQNPPAGDYASMFSEDKINQFAKAQQILTPEQLASFQQFLTSQRDLQMAGMKMAAQMFAPK
jgi:hypothetical protein